jgi:hypothetical protein
MNDLTTLSQLGLSDQAVIVVGWRASPRCRLYFLDMEERLKALDFDAPEKVTFGLVAKQFSDDPRTVGFYVGERQLRHSNFVESVFGDPALPVSIGLQSPRLHITWMHDFDTAMEVDETTTIDQVQAHVRDRLGSLINPDTKFRLFFQKDKLALDLKVFDVNPDLLLPFKVHLGKGIRHFTFKHNDELITLHLLKGQATCHFAIPRLAEWLHTDGANIKVIRGQAELGPTERLDEQQQYVVRLIEVTICCKLQLSPQPPGDFSATLSKDAIVKLGSLKSVGDLLAQQIDSSIKVAKIVCSNQILTAASQLKDLGPNPVIELQYPGPAPEATYSFKGTTLTVRADMRVCDVASLILNNDLMLPSVLKLAYWGIKLRPLSIFRSYGIPEGAEIAVTEFRAKNINIKFPNGSAYDYSVTGEETPDDLKRFVCRRLQLGRDDFSFVQAGAEVAVAKLKQLPEARVEVALKKAKREFECSTGKFSLDLPPDATILTAMEAIAAHFGQSVFAIQLFIAGEQLEDDQKPLSSVSGAIRVVFLQDITFSFRKENFPLTVNFDANFGTFKADLAVLIGEELTPEDIEFVFDGSTVPDEATPNDLGIKPKAVVTVRDSNAPPEPTPVASGRSQSMQPGLVSRTEQPPPAPGQPAAAVLAGQSMSPASQKSKPNSGPPKAKDAPALPQTVMVPVTLLLGIVPRRMKFPLAADTTVEGVLAAAKARWELEGIDVDLVFGDPKAENWRQLPRGTKVASLDLNGDEEFGVRQKEVDLPQADELCMSFMRKASAILPAVPQTGTPYRFSVAQRGIDECILYFAQGQTVGDAKVRLAADFELPGPEYVTLLFLGKQLKDSFKLERLRLGNKPIIVSLRDIAEILIVTARAFRLD